MPQGEPKNGEFYLHFKNKLYQVITVAKHSESGEELVIYQALYDDFQTFARPISMFTSEVDKEKYPEVSQKYRFELYVSEKKKTKEKKEEKIKDPIEDELIDLHPKFISFLDAETIEERYNILLTMEDIVTDELIDSMAIVMDLVVPEGALKNRYLELKKCVQTVMKYQLKRI